MDGDEAPLHDLADIAARHDGVLMIDEAHATGVFDRIAGRETPWRVIPAEFGVDGFFGRHEHHYVYWRVLSDGSVGIVTVLHERMHQMDRFREDIAP
jgi:hypothetical protein